MAEFRVVTRLSYWESPGGTLLKFFSGGALIGTLLLALPVSRQSEAALLDLVFTAVSAITVTGLITLDTPNDFSPFGQVVIAALIMVGGLGYMLVGTLTLLGKAHLLSLRQQATMGGSTPMEDGLTLFSLVRFVLLFSATSTLLTAVLLSFWWVPAYGWPKGIGHASFHAISAFNNAGFALFSDSLESAAGGQPVRWIHALAFILGGLGFTVVYEVVTPGVRWKLHTRIMVYGSLFLLFLGTVLLMVFERETGVLGEGTERLTNAFFQTATTRTAGFNSVDISAMSPASIAFMMINMVIGAGPGSTAGGIRLTTFVLLLTGLFAALQGRQSTRLLGRTLHVEYLLRASGILVLTLALLSVLAIALLAIEPDQDPLALIFEVVSALGTVGLSLGVTGDLSNEGKALIVVVMLIGKVTPVVLFSALTGRSDRPIKRAGGNIALG